MEIKIESFSSGAISFCGQIDPKFQSSADIHADNKFFLKKDVLTNFNQGVTISQADRYFSHIGGHVSPSKAVDLAESLSIYGESMLTKMDQPVWVFFWDCVNRKAIIANDKMRINNIYWTKKKSNVYFATSFRDLQKISNSSLEIDYTAIFNLLDLSCVTGESSIDRNINKILGGHAIIVTDTVKKIEYFSLNYIPKLSGGESELKSKALIALNDAVASTIEHISEREFGCFLSGGTDSSSILALSSKIKKAPITAYSIAFTEEDYSELEYAKLAASHCKADHRIIHFTEGDVWRILDSSASKMDEPYGNSSFLAAYKLVETAKDDGKIFLVAGDGGDEIFGGNERYSIDAMYSKYGSIFRSSLGRKCETLLRRLNVKSGYPLFSRVSNILKRGCYSNPIRYYLDDAFALKICFKYFNQDFLCAIDPFQNLQQMADKYFSCDSKEEIDRLLKIDVAHTLGDNDLVKVQSAGRINGTRIVYPMLREEIVNFTCKLPGWAKLKGRQKRYIFKKALEDTVPVKILYKPKKGFGVPISVWMKTSKKFQNRLREVLFDSTGITARIIRSDKLEEMIKDNETGKVDLSSILYNLASLNLWYWTAR